MKKKKKFKLDYISSLMLSSFLLAIAYENFQSAKGKGFSASLVVAIIAAVLVAVIMTYATKDAIKRRREMLMAQYEAQQAAEETENSGDEDAEGEDSPEADAPDPDEISDGYEEDAEESQDE